MIKKVFFPWLLLSYFLIISSSFFLFCQTDLFHSSLSSLALLDGHILDFYDYNKPYFLRNDYLPILYIFFAVWNIPLKLFGLTSQPENWMNPLAIEIAWSKILIIIFFMFSAIIVKRIAEKITLEENNVLESPGILFITSPIAIFIIFIFSQYDIFSVFFSLIGIYYYLNKNLSKFLLYFSIAISFKFFALVIFVPLLLMAEKNLLKISKFILISISISILQFFIYSKSAAFVSIAFENIKFHMLKNDSISTIPINRASIAFFISIITCIYIYTKKNVYESKWKRNTILIPIIFFGFMQLAFNGNPQWKILVMPYFALSYLFISNKMLMAYLDAFAILVFLLINFVAYPGNIDSSLINHGIVHSLYPSFFVPEHSYLLHLHNHIPRAAYNFLKIIFYLYLFSPLILITYENYFKPEKKEVNSFLFFIRFFSFLAFFILSSFCSAFS